MNNNVIALPGKATGLPAYRHGADLAVMALEEMRRLAACGQCMPGYLGECLGRLPPDGRRGFLVVLACYVSAALVTAPDEAMKRKIGEFMAALDDEGGAA